MSALVVLTYNGKLLELALAHNTVRALRAIESLAKAETDSIRGDIKHNSDDDTATRVRKLQQVHDYDDARAIVAALRMLVTP